MPVSSARMSKRTGNEKMSQRVVKLDGINFRFADRTNDQVRNERQKVKQVQTERLPRKTEGVGGADDRSHIFQASMIRNRVSDREN